MTTPVTSSADLFRRLREQAQRAKPVNREPVSSRALAAIELRERLEARLRPALAALQEVMPELQPVRRVDSGAWILGLARRLAPEDRPGRAARPYSRIEFAVEIDPDLGTGSLTCHATTFDRDAPTRLEVFRLDQLKDERIDTVAEECCLDFARRWHAAREMAADARIEAEVALKRVIVN
jgi:hypothetical protein